MASLAFKRILVHTCDIQEWADAGNDDFGQPEKEWSTISANERCRLVTNKTGRPYEAVNPRTGDVVLSEYQVFIDINSDTWNYTTETPLITEQSRLVFTSPYDLTLNVELVAERAHRSASNHLEVFCNRAYP
jgi:hypothetical protein